MQDTLPLGSIYPKMSHEQANKSVLGVITAGMPQNASRATFREQRYLSNRGGEAGGVQFCLLFSIIARMVEQKVEWRNRRWVTIRAQNRIKFKTMQVN